MPIEVTWADPEKTIVLATFSGDWTWEEYALATAKIIELTTDIAYRIDKILDMRESTSIPRGPSLTYLHQADKLAQYQNDGINVLVGASPILHGLVSALNMTNPKRSPRVFAESIEEAYALIQADRDENNQATSND